MLRKPYAATYTQDIISVTDSSLRHRALALTASILVYFLFSVRILVPVGSTRLIYDTSFSTQRQKMRKWNKLKKMSIRNIERKTVCREP